MFQTNVVEKIKTHILRSVTFFLKSCRLRDNIEKYCRAEQATDDYGTCALRAEYIGTNAHSGCVLFIAFPLNNGCTSAPKYYVIPHCLSCFPTFYLHHHHHHICHGVGPLVDPFRSHVFKCLFKGLP